MAGTRNRSQEVLNDRIWKVIPRANQSSDYPNPDSDKLSVRGHGNRRPKKRGTEKRKSSAADADTTEIKNGLGWATDRCDVHLLTLNASGGMKEARKGDGAVRKRSAAACVRCRQQKVKCTGDLPCSLCARRKLPCKFDDNSQKVVVTKAYIKDLERRASHRQSETTRQDPWRPLEQPSADVGRDALQDDVTTWLGSVQASQDTAEPQNPANRNILENGTRRVSDSPSAQSAQLMNPLAEDAGNYVSDSTGRPIHLGKSSNWSFGRRVLRMSCDRLGIQLPAESLHFEGSVYNLDWQVLRQAPEPHRHALPAPDYAIYLINATKFHCGQLFHLFEEEDFMRNFSLFHEDKNGISRVSQLWYVHYLLVLAFGKAFVTRNAPDGRPPGVNLFFEAMRHLPEVTFFSTDSIEAIEILICAALYLQCLDFRSAAYNLIGQALRKSLEQGMHTQMCFQSLSDTVVQRCRKVWWTVYILDRQMSSLMGLPIAVREEDVSAPLPIFPDQPQRKIAVELHVKLSRVIADILNTVYSTEGRLAKRFIISTKQALKSIAELTSSLKQHFELPDPRSLGGVSRVSAYLYLLHHHCIALTTRPLAYSFLERRLKNPGGTTSYYCPTGSVRALLKTCIESAQQMLLILSILQNQGLLESFLPFDLESVFISTIVFIMCSAIDSSLLEGHEPWFEVAYSILDEMASHGNMIAAFRKRELQKLASVLSHLPPPHTVSQSQTQPGLEHMQLGGNGQNAPRLPSAANIDYALFDGSVWPDDLMNAEQLMTLADSLDLDGVDWMTASLEDSSSRSQIL